MHGLVNRSPRTVTLFACALFTIAAAARGQGAGDQAHLTVVARSAAGPAAGVLVTATGAGTARAITGDSGRTRLTLPAGHYTVVARRIGFAPDSLRLTLRPSSDTTVELLLREGATVIAPVIISSTRMERRVEDEPLRVETLTGEDIGEKTQMHPADIRTLLVEMPGVRVQPTAVSLGGAALRIQGLRGRYTDILTDGLPLYGANAGSFGLLQIPPVDLRQAEVIKGAASALYGPVAMGGVVNLLSRRYTDSSEAVINATARGGADAVAFLGHTFGARAGATLTAGLHTARITDVDGDGWSDIPGFRRIEARPRLMLSDSAGRTLMITAGGFAERRGGGTADARVFPESLSTGHLDAGFAARSQLGSAFTIEARAAVNAQQRDRRFGAQSEHDRASALFGEATGAWTGGMQTLLVGVASQQEKYANREVQRFDESRTTPAVFVQHGLVPARWLSTQLNARCDASSRYGTICTPRASVLVHSGSALSARFSAASGWSAPTPLVEETEAFGLTRVAGPLNVSAERARTASLDLGAVHGPFEASATLFTSRVRDPVGLRRIAGDSMGGVQLVNAAGPADVHGAELFAVYNEEPFIVTAFYALARTRETSPESGRLRESPYVPRENAGLDMAFEEDDSGTRLGIELFYTGPQAVEENAFRTVAPAYATVGILASQRLGAATVYLNLENLTGVRQTKYDPFVRPTVGEGGRRTVDAWAPVEGRVANIGMVLRF